MPRQHALPSPWMHAPLTSIHPTLAPQDLLINAQHDDALLLLSLRPRTTGAVQGSFNTNKWDVVTAGLSLLFQKTQARSVYDVIL